MEALEDGGFSLIGDVPVQPVHGKRSYDLVDFLEEGIKGFARLVQHFQNEEGDKGAISLWKVVGDGDATGFFSTQESVRVSLHLFCDVFEAHRGNFHGQPFFTGVFAHPGGTAQTQNDPALLFLVGYEIMQDQEDNMMSIDVATTSVHHANPVRIAI